MTQPEAEPGTRVLIMAPTSRDAEITCRMLEQIGRECRAFLTMKALVEAIDGGVGALLLTEEIFTASDMEKLLVHLNAQPAWSEIPVVMMMRGGVDSPVAARVLKALRNVTLLERPAPMRSVQSAVDAAVRGRQRQYLIRDQMAAIRHSESRATELQQRLEMSLEASELGTFHCPMPLGRIEWNERCKAHFWLAPEAAVDMDLFYAILHPEDRARTRVAVEACVNEGKNYDIEYRTVSPTGQIRWVRATGRTYTDDHGCPQRFDGTTQDITQRKEIEHERENLLQSERMARTDAERANRIKDEFLATVSHELRTPLNAILGWTQLLRRGRADPSQVEEAVDVIDRNARLQAQLIEDLLDMSRIISGKIRLEQKEFEVIGVVEAAVQTVRLTAREKMIEILVMNEAALVGKRNTEGLRPLLIRGDAGRLQQVIWNLLSNAVKFTPENGCVTVRLRRVRGEAEIRVTDTGEGMDPAFIPQMFERFRQADSSIARRHGGLGLGLAIVKQLVELHGGTVEAESQGLGLGSSFIVRLPEAGPLPPDTEMGEMLGASLPPTTKVEFADLRGLKVLVVDDDADARRLLKRLLTECRAEVKTAASGAEALALLATAEGKPEVLISDIGMPGMDGYELISRIHTMGPQWQALPAAAVTAFTRADDKSRALRAGYQRHVSKPIEPAELIAVVAMLGGRVRVNGEPGVKV